MSTPLQKLFGNAMSDATASTQLMLCLSSLETLHWDGAECHWTVAKFPKLEKLSLARGCTFLYDMAAAEKSKSLHTLVLHVLPGILKRQTLTSRYCALPSFLRHLPGLKNLTVSLYRCTWSDSELVEDGLDDEKHQGSFQYLVAALAPVRESFGKLTIVDDSEAWAPLLDYVRPAVSIKDFTALKILSVPYDFLPTRFDYADIGEKRRVSDILPSSLEVLVLVNLRLDLYDFLKLILVGRHTMPSLIRIELCPSVVRGAPFEAFAFANDVCAELKEEGIDVLLC
jgi:hypothetical protein